MHEHVLIGLAGIVILGIAAQWVAWRLRLPAILLLLLLGFAAGPITGWIHPDELLGDLLFPVVSLSVALILFEGGMSLKLSELKEIGGALRNLILIGTLVTWAATASAAYFILGFDFMLALLLGAILVVTGPTVIVPLLRTVRPSGAVGPILKWEGMLIDPIGATLALLVFQAIIASERSEAVTAIALAVFRTIVGGTIIGVVAALLLAQMLRRYWIPDFLQSPFALMTAIGAFVLSNMIQEESGLLAVTVLGIALANQKIADIGHIIEFKENLRVLLISGLFIILAARLDWNDIQALSWRSLVFVGILIAVIRPLSVALSTLGTNLVWQERAFLAWLAPRGIVAAAVSSVFAIRLTEISPDFAAAADIAPVTFLVIVATVSIYGLTALPVARKLGVARPDAEGVLIIGAHYWARSLAAELGRLGFNVLLADNSWANIRAARMAGLRTYHGNILAEHVLDEIDLGGIGRIIGLTANDEINTLSTLHFAEVFGQAEVFQLPRGKDYDGPALGVPETLRGRELFGPDRTYEEISRSVAGGADVKSTSLSEEFGFDAFLNLYGKDAVPIAVVTKDNKLKFFTSIDPPKPQPGDSIVSFVREITENKTKESGESDPDASQRDDER